MDSVKTLNYSVFVKSLEDQMAFYAAYHQNARNKATHFVGVPAIMLSLFIPLAWIRFDIGGVTLTAAMLFAAVVLIYYFMLDVPLGPLTAATVSGTLSSAAASKRIDDFLVSIFELLCAFSSPYGS